MSEYHQCPGIRSTNKMTQRVYWTHTVNINGSHECSFQDLSANRPFFTLVVRNTEVPYCYQATQENIMITWWSVAACCCWSDTCHWWPPSAHHRVWSWWTYEHHQGNLDDYLDSFFVILLHKDLDPTWCTHGLCLLMSWIATLRYVNDFPPFDLIWWDMSGGQNRWGGRMLLLGLLSFSWTPSSIISQYIITSFTQR